MMSQWVTAVLHTVIHQSLPFYLAFVRPAVYTSVVVNYSSNALLCDVIRGSVYLSNVIFMLFGVFNIFSD